MILMYGSLVLGPNSLRSAVPLSQLKTAGKWNSEAEFEASKQLGTFENCINSIKILGIIGIRVVSHA